VVVTTDHLVDVQKPKTEEELVRVLHEAAEARKAVVPVGGGRASGMGGVVERCDVELHTGGLDRVIEHSPADMVVTVEAGVTLEALQSQLASTGQFLPIDPFNSPGHTVGGLLATGWSGPLRLRFGSARDFLIGIRVALPDGRLASAGGRVVKNVSGYDLMKLHYGAMGSLGVIVAASFKVFPKPLHDVTLESRHARPDEAWQAAERALDLALPPVALEMFSDGRLLARFFGSPDAVKATASGLGWKETDASVWQKHSQEAPNHWARISVPRTRLRGVLDSLPAKSTWWASPGVGVAHWTFKDGEELTAARAAAEAAGGSLVLMAAPDASKRQAGAWGTPPATLEVMRRLKDAFDPDHVLNPGRFVV
jgi:glycolate oxidase FAD binding subunit